MALTSECLDTHSFSNSSISPLFVTDENTEEERRRSDGVERSDIIPLNLIDSVWRRFLQRKLPKALRLRSRMKETLCYSQILQLFLIPHSCTKIDGSFVGKFTAATPPQETEDLESLGFAASCVDSGSDTVRSQRGHGVFDD